MLVSQLSAQQYVPGNTSLIVGAAGDAKSGEYQTKKTLSHYNPPYFFIPQVDFVFRTLPTRYKYRQ